MRLDYDEVRALRLQIPMTDSVKKQMPQSGTTPKKAYRAPVLSQFGDVQRLTRGGAGMGSDGGPTPGMTRVCWIAEALYGIDTPRVVLVRSWLTRCYERRYAWALFIVPLYLRFGPGAASAIRAFPALRLVFRPVFDLAVRRAYRGYAARAVARRDPD